MAKNQKRRTQAQKNWDALPEQINEGMTEYATTCYGISNSMAGNEVWVDFGDELGQPIAMAKILFHNREAASAVYCRGIKLCLIAVQVDM